MPSDPTSTRDPRTEPKPGDVLRSAGVTVAVTAASETWVKWDESGDGYDDICDGCRMHVFRRWAKDAEVLNRGND